MVVDSYYPFIIFRQGEDNAVIDKNQSKIKMSCYKNAKKNQFFYKKTNF